MSADEWVCRATDTAGTCTGGPMARAKMLDGHTNCGPDPTSPPSPVPGERAQWVSVTCKRNFHGACAIRGCDCSCHPSAPSVPGGGTGQRPDDPLGIEQTVATLMALGNELLAEGRIDQASAAFVAAGYIDADAKLHAANRNAPPASPVPPTPTPQPDGELRAEISVLVRALWQACHDGWADGDSAMAGYLNHARTVLADDYEDPTPTPPSTPAEQPRPWNRKNCESCGISFARCTDRLAEHGACCARCHTTDTHDDLRPPSSGTDAT